MILILSERQDYATDIVISYIRKIPGAKVFRLNIEDILSEYIYIDISSDGFLINDFLLKYEDVTTVWYRRFGSSELRSYFDYINDKISHKVSLQLHRENETIKNYICYKLEHSKWLNHYSSVKVNKLEVLDRARTIGLTIPDSVVTSKSKDMIDNISYVTKSVFEPAFFDYNNSLYATFTTEIGKREMPEKFFPSLIQNHIVKTFEIRSFYLSGKFYSMAIFSQEHEQTKTDFRKYVKEKPNRFIPYKLPNNIEKKLMLLMESINLDSGSIDLIVDKCNDYVFLEVNPVGQFGMIESRCNYGLYKLISEKLIEIEK